MEATCDQCGETFRLEHGADSIHYFKYDGSDCGGWGRPNNTKTTPTGGIS